MGTLCLSVNESIVFVWYWVFCNLECVFIPSFLTKFYSSDPQLPKASHWKSKCQSFCTWQLGKGNFCIRTARQGFWVSNGLLRTVGCHLFYFQGVSRGLIDQYFHQTAAFSCYIIAYNLSPKKRNGGRGCSK